MKVSFNLIAFSILSESKHLDSVAGFLKYYGWCLGTSVPMIFKLMFLNDSYNLGPLTSV